jgi:hypothetical protein
MAHMGGLAVYPPRRENPRLSVKCDPRQGRGSGCWQSEAANA